MKLPRVLNCSQQQYFADDLGVDVPCLSHSIAVELINESPSHAHLIHAKLGNQAPEPTEAQERGNILHSLLLGKGKDVVLLGPEYNDFKTKEARRIRDEARAAGKIPVLAHKMPQYEDLIRLLRQRMSVWNIGMLPECETVILWTEFDDAGFPVICKAMIDNHVVAGGSAVIRDFKFPERAHPRVIAKHMDEMGYAIQQAAYTSAINALYPETAGRTEFEFLFFEIKPPYNLVPVKTRGMTTDYGYRSWRKAINIWSKCLQTGEWPGYATDWLYIDLATWKMKELEAEMEEEYS